MAADEASVLLSGGDALPSHITRIYDEGVENTNYDTLAVTADFLLSGISWSDWTPELPATIRSFSIGSWEWNLLVSEDSLLQTVLNS